MEFTINFKWHRDEAYDAMNDTKLDETARNLYMSMMDGQITCETIRTMNQELKKKNEELAREELKTFMTADYDGMPRYVQYIKDIMDYGVYYDSLKNSPSSSVDFINSIHVISYTYGFEVGFIIPDDFYIEGQKYYDYIAEMKSFKDTLSDTIWEGMPGSLGVHDSSAVVTYDVW
jgi:serine protease inhibitor